MLQIEVQRWHALQLLFDVTVTFTDLLFKYSVTQWAQIGLTLKHSLSLWWSLSFTWEELGCWAVVTSTQRRGFYAICCSSCKYSQCQTGMPTFAVRFMDESKYQTQTDSCLSESGSQIRKKRFWRTETAQLVPGLNFNPALPLCQLRVKRLQ